MSNENKYIILQELAELFGYMLIKGVFYEKV